MTLGPGEHCTTQELSEYLDRQLAPAAEERVRAHLSACEACAESYDALSSTVMLVRQLPALPPPRDFRIGPRAARPSQAQRLYPWTRAASAVAAAMFLILFVVDLGGLAAPRRAASLKAVAAVTATAVAPQADMAPAGGAAAPKQTVAPSSEATSAGAAAPAPAAGAAESVAAAAPTCDPNQVCAAAVGQQTALPTATASPRKQPTAALAVPSVEPASSPGLWPWEALALALALAFAAVTWALARQARPRPG